MNNKQYTYERIVHDIEQKSILAQMSTSLDLKDIDAFAKIARAGSISRAAEIHGTPKSSLSHSLRRLEDHLGVELFTRANRKLELTDAGKEYLLHSAEIVSVCENAFFSIQKLSDTPQGVLKIATESEFGVSIVGPLVQQAAKEHSKLGFDISILLENPRRPEELDADCVIYIGTPPDSDLIGKLLGTFTYGLYATPEYLSQNGTPSSIKDLKKHRSIGRIKNGQVENWQFFKTSKLEEFTPRSNITINSYWMVKFFATGSMGIAYLPGFFVQQEIADKTLLPILTSWKTESVPVYALYHRHRYKSNKLQVFIESCLTGFSSISTSHAASSLD